MTILVTGAAGFIGYHICQRLLAMGARVVGVDNFKLYYDPALKAGRAARLTEHPAFRMETFDIADPGALSDLVRQEQVSRIIHLAAQAGVRHSIDHPFDYAHDNLVGHLSVLEACRHAPEMQHLVYASSSSVYGDRPQSGAAFRETDAAVEPVSLYAASKRAGELMSHSYGRLYGLPQTGLRFFTVYGPWGRPDMAYFSFTKAILAGEAIQVFGDGQLSRDFTFIDDIVDGLVAALDQPPEPGVNRILNIGAGQPVGLMTMINALERALGREAIKTFLPMQPGDVTATWADVSALTALTGYRPHTDLETGLGRFVDWYRSYYADDV